MKELQEMKLHFKRLSKRNFLKVGKGDARGGRADREGVCEMDLCNCSDIFIESPPSLSCVLKRASLMPVDGESSRGAVFSIIPEAIVRAASERLTVASWDFTKTQHNTRRKGWDMKIRGGGGVRMGKQLRREMWGLEGVMKKEMQMCQILYYMECEETCFVYIKVLRDVWGWLDDCRIRVVVVVCAVHTGSKCETFISRCTAPVGP